MAGELSFEAQRLEMPVGAGLTSSQFTDYLDGKTCP
jgi:hypothetical protein